MQKNNRYTIIFALCIAAFFAFVLSIASELLKERQVQLERADMKKNILQAVGLLDELLSNKCKLQEIGTIKENNIDSCFNSQVKSYLLNYNGEVVANSKIDALKINIEKELDKDKEKQLFPIFIREKNGKPVAYCLPVYGKGLWSSIYGFIALEKDFNTILGLTFYKQKETPGLGAEIEKKWFTSNFKGKKILDKNNKLISITVVKGKVDKRLPASIHQVDGITGATYTCRGVTKLLLHSLELYMPYYNFIKKQGK